MSGLERPKILVIGELNVDIVATGLRSAPEMGTEILAGDCELTLGSASAIFAAGMAKLGHSVTFVSQVGRDYFGDFCVRTLQHLGVSTRHVTRKAEEKTGVTIALSGKHDRALVTYAGAVATFKADSIDETMISKHDHLHLTSYYLQTGLRPSFANLFRQAKSSGLTTSFDPNSDPRDKWDRNIDSVLNYTDVLFVNEREAMKLTRSNTTNDALKTLGTKVNCAVVKRGAHGATAIQNEKLFNTHDEHLSIHRAAKYRFVYSTLFLLTHPCRWAVVSNVQRSRKFHSTAMDRASRIVAAWRPPME